MKASSGPAQINRMKTTVATTTGVSEVDGAGLVNDEIGQRAGNGAPEGKGQNGESAQRLTQEAEPTRLVRM